MDMEIPVIDLSGLGNGDATERSQTLARLHEACKDWGFFWVENHGVDGALMEEVKSFVHSHYEEQLKDEFYASDLAKDLHAAAAGRPEDQDSSNKHVSDQAVDWETAYFVRHHPNSNVADFPEIPPATREVLDVYIGQMVSLAEQLAEGMSLNLGLKGGPNHIRDTFAPPFVGTKFAMYPACPRPDLVWGLRAHTDAGGIILLFQDDQVGGLQLLKDGAWVDVPPTRHSIVVNLGDQLEVITSGRYKSVLHRVVAQTDGNRMSIASFYNPASDAVIFPAPALVKKEAGAGTYPKFVFEDYMKLYVRHKFEDKEPRFEAFMSMETDTSKLIATA